MNRYRGLVLIMAASAIVAIPANVAAQKFKDDKYTKEADKYIALATMRSDSAARTQMYQQALDALQEGLTKAADNAKVWLKAGVAYVGLGRYAEATTAFDRTLELYPDAADEVEAERESGWIQAFTQGVALMDNGPDAYPKALSILEAGEALYPKRPEALLNMGSMYAALGQNDKAEEAFRKAAAAAQGELYEKVDSATQQTWDGYVSLATLNLAQIRGSVGVAAFQAGDYEVAATAFQQAMEVNPYSRDYLLNFVNAEYAKVSDMEDEVETDSSKLAQYKPRMIELYATLQREIPKVREFDPTNRNIMMIHVRAVRRENELKGDTTAAQQGALAILQEAEAIPVEIVDMAVQPGDGTATIAGKIHNRSLAPNSTVKLTITLLGLDGAAIGNVDVETPVGEAEVETPFEQTAQISAQVAGWRYRVATS